MGEDEGFAEQRISALLEDHEGFLWIGTLENGLFRYNGYEFKSFQTDYQKHHSRLGAKVNFVFEDSRNLLWVGTESALSYYHPGQQKFYILDLADFNSDSIRPTWFTAMEENKQGELMLGTINGIFVLSNISKAELLGYPGGGTDSDTFHLKVNYHRICCGEKETDDQVVSDLKIMDNKQLWLVHGKQLGVLKLSDFIQSQPDDSSGAVNDFTYRPVVCDLSRDKMYIADTNKIWVSFGDSISILTLNADHIEPKTMLVKRTLSSINNFSSDAGSGKKLWIGFTQNIRLFDTGNNNTYPLTFESNDINTLHLNYVSCFHRTRSGTIFIGTNWGGLYKFNPHNVYCYSHPNLQNIHLEHKENLRYVCEDSRGLLWMIADELYCCDKFQGNVIARFSNDFFDQQWCYGNKLLEDTKGQIWLGREGRGLNRLLVDDYDIQSIRSEKVLDRVVVSALCEDPNGFVWVGAKYRDKRVFKYHTALLKVSLSGYVVDTFIVKSWPAELPKTHHQYINHIYIDDDNVLWLACGFGLVRFDEIRGNVQQFHYPAYVSPLSQGYRILSICKDPVQSHEYFWIGTAGGGLVKFNKKDTSFKPFEGNVHLPSQNVNSILTDKLGSLWIGTDKGVAKIGLETKNKVETIKIFNKSNGLLTSDFSYYYGHNAMKTKDGDLIFSGPKSFHIVKPDQIKTDPFSPPFYISDYFIHYNSAKSDSTLSYTKNQSGNIDKLVLPYTKNTLGIEITALDYVSTQELTYAFFLENFDNEWINNGDHQVIHYPKLPPGDFYLKVKVANSDGVWSKPKSVLQLEIERPWWLSRLAYVVYLCLIAMLMGALMYWQRKRHELQLRVEIANMEAGKLKEMDALKSKFFTNISHEFRTPLTLIMNPVEDLLDRVSDVSDRKALIMIKRNAKQLLHYISEILDLTKLEANQMKLHISKVDLVEFAKYLIAPYESWLDQKRINLNFTESNNEIFAFLDPDKLNTILGNLLSNAIKYSSEGGTIDFILALKSGQGKDLIVIKIRNSGVGIPKENIPFVFNRYYRADSQAGGKVYGSGIGLALVKELVTLHQGTIEVHSEVGKFTEFVITFPHGECPTNEEDNLKPGKGAVDLEVLPHQMAQDVAAVKCNSPEGTGDKIILVIEDNSDMRSILKNGLMHDYKILEAKNGKQGEELAIKSCPDLIISDVMMPKKNGFEVAYALKRNVVTSHIPIILLTAKAEITDKIEGLETGADDYLIKPFNSQELRTRVKNLLEQRKNLKEKYSTLSLIKTDESPATSIDESFLQKVIKVIEDQYTDPNFKVQDIMDQMSMSRAQIHRKIKALTDKTPNELIRTYRLEQASKMLKSKTSSISEIAYQVGFSNTSYFNRVFKEYFGHTPSEM